MNIFVYPLGVSGASSVLTPKPNFGMGKIHCFYGVSKTIKEESRVGV